MQGRHLASLAALASLALVISGCPDEGKGSSGASTSKPASTHATPASTGTAASTSKASSAEAFGKGVIKGKAKFSGKAPEMKTPTARAKADFCKDKKDVPYNAVIVSKDGGLKDVFVRIANGEVKGKYDTPKEHVEIEQKDCMYSPRIQGAMVDQDVDIKNEDGTLHNVHTYKNTESWFNQGQPKGSPAVDKPMPDDPTFVKFACDVHPWMRGFIVVTDHPFYAVSKEDGTFEIDKIPPGHYNVEAWHSHYGLHKGTVDVADDKPATWDVEFKDSDPEPDINKDELKGLW